MQAAQEFVQLAEGEPFIVQLGWGALCACVPAPLRCGRRACFMRYPRGASRRAPAATQILLLLAGAGGVGPQRGA
jgi:hypothetical protein